MNDRQIPAVLDGDAPRGLRRCCPPRRTSRQADYRVRIRPCCVPRAHSTSRAAAHGNRAKRVRCTIGCLDRRGHSTGAQHEESRRGERLRGVAGWTIPCVLRNTHDSLDEEGEGRRLRRPSERSTPSVRGTRRGIDPRVSPVAFLNMARQYARAATELLSVRKRDAGCSPSIELAEPTYFVSCHAIELALKAFLLFHGRARGGHKLDPLFWECRRLGLVVGTDDATNIGNIVSLLDSGNEDYAFRYFTRKSTCTADLEWTAGATDALIQAVARAIEPADRTPGPAIKGRITMGRPVPKDAP